MTEVYAIIAGVTLGVCLLATVGSLLAVVVIETFDVCRRRLRYRRTKPVT